MHSSLVHLRHGGDKLPAVIVDNYSLQLQEGDGFVGDSASRTAFRAMLGEWRKLFKSLHGEDTLGKKATTDISKKNLDALLAEKGPAAAIILSAMEDYAQQLADVVQRFMAEPGWRGVERVIIGGGFKESAVGRRAIKRTAELLASRHAHVDLRPLHHHADEGGLIGWLHLAPTKLLARYPALMAVDIGGTNVRCAIVRMRADPAGQTEGAPPKAQVIAHEKWGHADDGATRREDLIQGVAGMLEGLIRHAEKRRIPLAPFVGVACPGHIREDGSITAGAQNLPGDWEGRDFHLPLELCERLPRIDGHETAVRMHNDAVVQGLSDLPYNRDVRRWAVLTVGTGLGNACFTNR